jgi:hypothetical protein
MMAGLPPRGVARLPCGRGACRWTAGWPCDASIPCGMVALQHRRSCCAAFIALHHGEPPIAIRLAGWGEIASGRNAPKPLPARADTGSFVRMKLSAFIRMEYVLPPAEDGGLGKRGVRHGGRGLTSWTADRIIRRSWAGFLGGIHRGSERELDRRLYGKEYADSRGDCRVSHGGRRGSRGRARNGCAGGEGSPRRVRLGRGPPSDELGGCLGRLWRTADHPPRRCVPRTPPQASSQRAPCGPLRPNPWRVRPGWFPG